MPEYAMEVGRPDIGAKQSTRCGFCIAMAAICLTVSLWMAINYPVNPVFATAAIVIIAGMVWKWPEGWLIALPALLPVLAFAPWTGWITFEEFDMLILAMAAGGYAHATQVGLSQGGVIQRKRRHSNALPWLLVAIFSVSMAIAMVRGFADAGGFEFGWYQGYLEPMNSVRQINIWLVLVSGALWRTMLVAWTIPGRRRHEGPMPSSHRVAGLAGVVLVLGLGLGATDAQAQSANPRVQYLSVGPDREIKTLSHAAKLAQSGAVIEVDAGDYVGDVAVWDQDTLTLRAVGGRVRLVAAGAAAEEKAIWVMRGRQMSVDGFDFIGARVPDRNGAGIRLEKGKLRVRNCRFIENENGILTGNQPDTELEIENSEFGHNGYGDGQSHNLYAGAIAQLSVTGSYFHHAKVGHLLKTRAAVNHIFYNRLSDESGGRASYELEFAIGGVAYVVGNIIQQSPLTENPLLISFGAEGYKWPRNAIYLVNNTLVNDRAQGGKFLRVRPGDVTIRAVNNLLIGKGRLEIAGAGDYRSNHNVSHADIDPSDNYRLKARTELRGKVTVPEPVGDVNLQPVAEYTYPTGTRAIIKPIDLPGALQGPVARQRR